MPLPGGYLIELSLLAILAAAASLLGWPRSPILLWITSGIFLAFSFWGQLSIGLFFFPAFLLFLISSILAEVRHKRKFLSDLWAVAAGVLSQSALIWLMVLSEGLLQRTVLH